MKFRTQTILFLILVPSALIFFLLYLSTYVVRETDQVIITRFGQVRGNPVKDPGLHWKMPLSTTSTGSKNAINLGTVLPARCRLRTRLT